MGIWAHCKTIISVFREHNMQDPIIYLHNHDFNGLGGHIGAEILRIAQGHGIRTLVVDAAPRKNLTHNDNTIVTAALMLNAEQQDALLEYNRNQDTIESLLSRFNSRTSQMTPWDSDWAGGTEGSDIRICREFGIPINQINHAKEVATEVFPLERAVTPFSEYKLRLGIAIMIEPGIEPKTAEAVRKWVNGGGKLKVGGDVLVGLKRWETLVPKTPEVDKLLSNMPDELEAALAQKGKLIKADDLPASFTPAQVHTALGYQQKGFDFAKSQAQGKDLSPLLCAPHILHGKPRSAEAGTRFELLHNPSNLAQRDMIQFDGFGKSPDGEILLNFLHEGV